MRTVIVTTVIVLLGTLTTSRTPAKELVEIKVRGYYFAAPATVPMIVAVEPGARNRTLVVEADGDDYFRSSAIELEGENEKRLHSVEFRNLPAGTYVLRARVLAKTEVLGTAVERLVVTGLTDER